MNTQSRPVRPACSNLTISPDWDWPEFWSKIQTRLKAYRYRGSTRKLYRNVLRGLRSHCQCPPAEVTHRHIRDYLHFLGRRGLSASWIGMNVSVFHAVFARIRGKDFTKGFRCPKKPLQIPEILSPSEVRKLLAQAHTVRDQLLLGLLYGCGLRVGEACRLRWQDIDPDEQTLRAPIQTTGTSRTIRLPRQLLPVLREGVKRCDPSGFVFAGRRDRTHLSVRMAEYIIHRAAQAACIGIPVTSFTPRHSFAVHSLQNGMNIRQLQETLGHVHIETTMRYFRFTLPGDAVSPLDRNAPLPDSNASEPDTTEELFEEDPAVGPLVAQETWSDAARALYASLRIQLTSRNFLANRAIRYEPG